MPIFSLNFSAKIFKKIITSVPEPKNYDRRIRKLFDSCSVSFCASVFFVLFSLSPFCLFCSVTFLSLLLLCFLLLSTSIIASFKLNVSRGSNCLKQIFFRKQNRPKKLLLKMLRLFIRRRLCQWWRKLSTKNALAAWRSGQRIRPKEKKTRVRIPPGCNAFKSVYIDVLKTIHNIIHNKINLSKNASMYCLALRNMLYLCSCCSCCSCKHMRTHLFTFMAELLYKKSPRVISLADRKLRTTILF
jgi:hypothetical protein